ncbi:NUDIX hydrolase [Bacillus salacetis]|uniref:NUDIX hydrolase n=1 Tax=Bacillus salacetis TaxID=2315464 RepID=UPI003B9E3046
MVILISQGIIVRDDYVLMVKQFVERGDVVWNFPGGGIESGETPEQAMIREVHEETGYWTKMIEQLPACSGKHSFIAEIVSGEMFLDKTLSENDDILEVAWIHIDDIEKFDSYTLPIRELIVNQRGLSV